MAFAYSVPLGHVWLRTGESKTTRKCPLALATPTASTSNHANVLVVGAGVIGLTTAIRLREAGHRVTIVALDTPASIAEKGDESKSAPYTSMGSGGYWMPFHSAGERFEDWCLRTYDILEDEAIEGGTGVTMHDGFILQYKNMPQQLPFYAERAVMRRVTHQDDIRVPKNYVGALLMRVPICRMDDYLPSLEARALGVGAILRQVDTALDLNNAREMARSVFSNQRGRVVVVNCTGVSAASFCEDESVVPGRGVTVRVRRPANGANYFITENDEDGIMSRDGLLAYCLPRGDEYTLGGTIYEGDWNTVTSGSEANELVTRCANLIPGIETWERTGAWTGLRPLRRNGIRLEAEPETGDVAVVSNYGHGGSGVTCCWGCAEEVVGIINRTML